MSLIHLSTELRQELKLTPQLLQSMELLQMNSQELLDYLNQVSEENPLVEQTDLSSLHKAYDITFMEMIGEFLYDTAELVSFQL